MLPRSRSIAADRCCANQRQSTLRCIALMLLPSILWLSNQHLALADDRETHFETSVRPLLVAYCVGCHGPLQQEGGLRLDSAGALSRGGDRGSVIEPTDPGASLLLEAVERTGDLQMPPDRTLDPDQVQALRIWIEQGAYWPQGVDGRDLSFADQHWSFQPVQAPSVPLHRESKSSSQFPRSIGDDAQRPLDLFLAQAQDARGLIPSSQAQRATLLRRLMFDLTGLPPEYSDIKRFVNDSRPDAYERTLDRILASATLGEHWTRHWLDVARYADNKGYVFFEQHEFPWAWTYRDWVRRSFDQDLPYDRFIIQQLAADQFDNAAHPNELAALGFLTVGGHFVNNSHDIIDDRIDVVTRGLTGLTMACARCHDHKYDPMTQADYYALYGVFASSYEPLVLPAIDFAADGQANAPAPTPEYLKELAARSNDLDQFVQTKVDGLSASARQRVDEYLLAVHERRNHPSAEEFMLIADTNDVNPAMITRYEAYLRDQVDERHPIWGPWLVWSLDEPPSNQNQPSSSDGDDSNTETPAVGTRTIADSWNPRLVEYLTEPPCNDRVDLAKRYGELFRWVDAQRSAAQQNSPEEAPALASEINWTDDDRKQLEAELFGAGRPAVLPAQLDWGFLSLFPDRATQGEYTAKLKALEQWLNEPQAPVRAMALLDRPEPADVPIALRGNPNRPGAVVARSIFIPGQPERQRVEQGSGRLELANAIAHPNHPTTDRVWVNRVWMHVMGEPIVSSPGDFGLRTNEPELRLLLDHLVVQFRAADRSNKALLRELCLSATYRRSSHASATTQAIDPANSFFASAHRKRLSFEAMRDSLLAVSGQLSSRQGGPSEKGIEQWGHLRTLYSFIDRLDVAPLLSRFDFPDPAATAPRRGTTTVPTQALFWLNDPQIERIARNLESQSQRLAPDSSAKTRIAWLIETLWQRAAEEQELQECVAFLITDASINSDASSNEASGVDPEIDPDTIGVESWIRLIQALMMSNETIFID